VRAALDTYDAARATRAVEAFVEDLSNWYVRRNRRRFWKGELDADKRAAYATLYEVLTTLTRVMAPFVPHLADALWESLVVAVDAEAPDSVHLVDFPADGARRDREVEASMELVRRVVALGRAARADAGLRTRQPLRTVRVKLPASASGRLSPDQAIDAELTAQVLEELNAKQLEVLSTDSELVERTLYPLLPVIGPRRGEAVGRVMAAVRSGDWRLLDDGRAEAGGVTLEADEFELTARARQGHEVVAEGDLVVALETELDDALRAEGLAREVAHRLQGLRKSAGYDLSDRIEASVGGDEAAVGRLTPHRDWLAGEVLATDLALAPDAALDGADAEESATLDGVRLSLAVRRTSGGSVG
jgi:isoleucyl-tRNA synthetase